MKTIMVIALLLMGGLSAHASTWTVYGGDGSVSTVSDSDASAVWK